MYGLSKTLAEQIAQYYRDTHQLEACALRLPLVFGPGLWCQGAAAELLRLLLHVKSNQPYRVSASAEPFDLIYAPDVAAAFYCAAQHPQPLAARYNLSGFVTSYPDIIATLQALQPAAQIDFSGQPAVLRYPLLATDLLTGELGFRPRWTLRAALRDQLCSNYGSSS